VLEELSKMFANGNISKMVPSSFVDAISKDMDTVNLSETLKLPARKKKQREKDVRVLPSSA